MGYKKFEMTDETMEYRCRILHRIKALRDFSDVKKGDLGGWIQKEENLSQKGNCWVYGNAVVSGRSSVWGNAMVYGNAWVYGNAKVYGNAAVGGALVISGTAIISSQEDLDKYLEAQKNESKSTGM
jgi:hypothetical protein